MQENNVNFGAYLGQRTSNTCRYWDLKGFSFLTPFHIKELQFTSVLFINPKKQLVKKATLLHYSFVIFCSFFLSLTGFAQQRRIAGAVNDGKNNTPLEGATVSVKNTNSSTITGADGKFDVSAPSGKVSLEVSFVGHETKTIVVGAGEANVAITLEPSESSQLSDVVIIGYGTQKRSDLTGSITSIKAEDLTLGGTISSAAQALQGKAAGVLVTQNSKASEVVYL